MFVYEERNLYSINEYGMVKCRLREILDERGLTRNKLSRLTGVRFETVNRLYNGKVGKVKTDVLARICYVLSCTTDDLFVYSPGPDAQTMPEKKTQV